MAVARLESHGRRRRSKAGLLVCTHTGGVGAGIYIPAVPDVGLVEQHGAAVVLVEQYGSCGEGVETLV